MANEAYMLMPRKVIHTISPLPKSNAWQTIAVHLNKIYIRLNEVPLFDLKSRLHLFGGIKMEEFEPAHTSNSEQKKN